MSMKKEVGSSHYSKKMSAHVLSNMPPQPTPTKIVVPANEQTYMFDSRTYVEKYVGHILSKSQWEQIFSEASKQMGYSWSKKKTHDLITLPKMMVTLGIICVLLTILYTVTLYLSTTSDEDNTILVVVATVSIASAIILSFILGVYNFTRKMRKFKSLEEIMKEDMDIYFYSINQKYKYRLNFNYMINNKWVECLIEDSKQQLEDEPQCLENGRNSGCEEFIPNPISSEREKNLISTERAHLKPIN